MGRIIFVGKTDNNFTYEKVYQLIHIEISNRYINTFIANDSNKIVFIPYASLEAFNDNWEVINE